MRSVIVVKSPDPIHTVLALLQESPLHLKAYSSQRANQASLASKPVSVEDHFVSINQFHPNFDPEKPFDFKHLITIQIAKCNQFHFFVLDSIFQDLGKVFRRHIGSSTAHHRVLVVIETTLKHFDLTVTFRLNATQTEEIPFDVIDK